MFPLFWIIGSCILLTPLSTPAPPSDADVEAAWMPEKTPEERARIVAHIRSVEVKWAKRLVAFFSYAKSIKLTTIPGVSSLFSPSSFSAPPLASPAGPSCRTEPKHVSQTPRPAAIPCHRGY